MTDDDRRLADRLRALESRIPVPDHGRHEVRPRRMPLAVLAAATGVLAVAVIVGSGVLRNGPSTGEASQTLVPAQTEGPAPSSSLEPTDSSVAVPSATSDPTLAPSVEPPPTPTSEPIASWRMTASFDSAPATSTVTDVVAWNGSFVAVGSAWPSADRIDREMPRLWTSSDGETWMEQPIDLGVNDISLKGIAQRGDGLLIIVGSVPGSGSNPDGLAEGTMAWTSDDAKQWTPMPLPLSPGLVVDAFAHGPMGYALSAGGEIWYSTDGIAWTRTYEGAGGVVAGQEGFVAILREDDTEATSGQTLVASADGRTWYESEPLAGEVLDIAPIGGDWLLVLAHFGSDLESHTMFLWHSMNGLNWAPSLDLNDLTGPDGPKTGRGLDGNALNIASLAGGSSRSFVTLQNNHCCAQPAWNYGVWSSTDGHSWTLAVEGDAFVGATSVADATEVAVGHLGRGDDAAFWIGERP